MNHADLLTVVRTLVQEQFSGLVAEAAERCCETILVRDGYYCGRRFTCDHLCAEWLADEPRIRFFASDGSYLKSITIPGESAVTARAA